VTPWVKRLLIANVVMFFAAGVVPLLWYVMVLVPALIPTRPWTLITYQFLHAGLWHLLFNMLGLFFFGPRLEARLGGRNFLLLYLVSGLMGGLLSLATPNVAIVGASAAVFGVLLGFARYWPRERIYIWGILPVEARVLVVVLTALALWGGIGGSRGGIAHFAHLGGFLGGYLVLKWLEWRSPARRFKKRMRVQPRFTPREGVNRWNQIPLDQLHPVNRQEVERLLHLVAEQGPGALSLEERALLDRFVPGGN
jgi:membrane associated rhomboid family serine protease